MWGQGRPQALQPGTTRSKVQFYLLAGTPNFSASPLARQLKGEDSGRPKKGGLALVNEAINVHGAEQSARTDTKQDFFFFLKWRVLHLLPIVMSTISQTSKLQRQLPLNKLLWH